MRNLAFAAVVGLLAAGPAMAGAGNRSQCTGVCAQGYIWAQENQIVNPEVCAGQPEEFAAGCGTYLNDTALGSADDEGDELN